MYVGLHHCNFHLQRKANCNAVLICSSHGSILSNMGSQPSAREAVYSEEGLPCSPLGLPFWEADIQIPQRGRAGSAATHVPVLDPKHPPVAGEPVLWECRQWQMSSYWKVFFQQNCMQHDSSESRLAKQVTSHLKTQSTARFTPCIAILLEEPHYSISKACCVSHNHGTLIPTAIEQLLSVCMWFMATHCKHIHMCVYERIIHEHCSEWNRNPNYYYSGSKFISCTSQAIYCPNSFTEYMNNNNKTTTNSIDLGNQLHHFSNMKRSWRDFCTVFLCSYSYPGTKCRLRWDYMESFILM